MVDGIGNPRRGIQHLFRGVDGGDGKDVRTPASQASVAAETRAVASAQVTLAARQGAAALDRAAAVGIHAAFKSTGGTALDAAHDPKTWWAGRPLSEAVNAHHTNTEEDLEKALASDANWFEGDIRTEINPPKALEMRHDEGQESGNNLTLREWLEKGKESGRGLKLDIKESDRMPEILDMIEEVGIPQERLMINLSGEDVDRWGSTVRERFPNATIAINPAGDPRDPAVVDKMIAQAQALGPPITFVIRHDQLDDDAIRRLQPYGTISTWNSQSKGVDDPAGEAERLRARGVDGMIDLNDGVGVSEYPGIAVDKAKNWLKGLTD